jgi:hypothetical protein
VYAILLCSTAFEQLARIQTTALGLADLPRLVVPHPIGGSSEDVATEKAQAAWPEFEGWLRDVVS